MKIRMVASASLEFQKFEFEGEVEIAKEDVAAVQKEFNDLAIQGLKDLVAKKRALALEMRK